MDNKTALAKFQGDTKGLPKTCKLGNKCDETVYQFLRLHLNFMVMEHCSLHLKLKWLIEWQPETKMLVAAKEEWEDMEFRPEATPLG